MSDPNPRNPDRQRQWDPDNRERRVKRRAEWGAWASKQPPRRWNGVDRG